LQDGERVCGKNTVSPFGNAWLNRQPILFILFISTSSWRDFHLHGKHSGFGVPLPFPASLSGILWQSAACECRKIYFVFPHKCGNMVSVRRSRACSLTFCSGKGPGMSGQGLVFGGQWPGAGKAGEEWLKAKS
jgi:hypothetical protein